MHGTLSSSVLEEIDISNNLVHSNMTLDLPPRWWTTTNSLNNLIQKNKPVIISLNANRFNNIKKSLPPKVTYWEIKQGDYQVKDKMHEFSDLLKRKRLSEMLLFTLFILCSGFTVLLVSSILYRTV